MPEDWNEADQDDSPRIDVEPYRKLVGSALFILKSRPDVEIALSKESSRTHKCTEKDMAVLRQTISYLHATRPLELVYSRDCSKQHDAVLEIFAWADNAFMCYIDSKSQNGFVCRSGIMTQLNSCGTVGNRSAFHYQHAKVRLIPPGKLQRR